MATRLAQLSRSPGGMPKLAIASAHITLDGVPEDWQLNRKYHGGRDRAICLYSLELYRWLNDQLGTTLAAGDIGENFTTEGIDLDGLNPGDCLSVSTCVIQLVKVREPCKQLNRIHPLLLQTILGHSGWVARVLMPGVVTTGDPITASLAPVALDKKGPR